jgi:hypothetical protein
VKAQLNEPFDPMVASAQVTGTVPMSTEMVPEAVKFTPVTVSFVPTVAAETAIDMLGLAEPDVEVLEVVVWAPAADAPPATRTAHRRTRAKRGALPVPSPRLRRLLVPRPSEAVSGRVVRGIVVRFDGQRFQKRAASNSFNLFPEWFPNLARMDPRFFRDSGSESWCIRLGKGLGVLLQVLPYFVLVELDAEPR